MARRTRWSDRFIDDVIASNGQANANLLPALDIDERDGITVARLIIHLTALPSPVSGVIGVQTIDYGIGLVSADALTAGIVPDPQTQTDRPSGGWLWRDRVGIVDDTVHVAPVSGVSIADLRAKRRVSSGELILTMDNLPASGTVFSVRVVGIVRTLILLP